MDIQNLYSTLKRKGLINLSFDEFSRLDPNELNELSNAVRAEYQLSGMIEPEAGGNPVAPEGSLSDLGMSGGQGATQKAVGKVDGVGLTALREKLVTLQVKLLRVVHR